ncbi:U6 snRNA-associated Sm LSm7 [Pyrrhoderma noxium]|uniref:U6 snRNA-associated Sm LSm7 n=1 Tax=Pyrrhoderma noxium TaxID=2282107 RepID=A0A286U897_9AGAM|nr:U6 snRNA-associated Sm LSm7 [Pyrrhoderma noxium]
MDGGHVRPFPRVQLRTHLALFGRWAHWQQQTVYLRYIHRYSALMADRARGAARGGNRGSGGGGRAGRGGPQGPQPSMEKPKREAILDLQKYMNERIRVKFTGGREVTGVLKGYDQLLNLVLDQVEELIQEPEPHIRTLGLVVLRGPTITLLNPVDDQVKSLAYESKYTNIFIKRGLLVCKHP